MVRVGVVGLGYWGPNLVRNFAASSRTQLVGVCDLQTERLETIGRQFPSAKLTTDPQELFDDPNVDAVAIATPVATHHDLATAALEAGKHVLVEKPLAATSDQAERLVSQARQARRVLMVDHVFLYSPAVRNLADLVSSGQLGELLFVDSVRINLGLFQHDVNVIWDLAPHDVSIIDHLVGRPVQSVVASGASHAGNGLADVAYLHLDYGNDLLASVHVNWLSPVKLRHFMVGGSRRSVLYNDLDPSERVKVYDRGIDVAEDPEGRRQVLISYRSGDVVAPRLESAEPLSKMVAHFAQCIGQGIEPLSSGDQGVRVVRVLEAAQESITKSSAQVLV